MIRFLASRLILLAGMLTGPWRTAAEAAHHAVLPALVLSLPCLASIVRSEMMEVLAAFVWLALKNAITYTDGVSGYPQCRTSLLTR